jgi:hypothetical protein
MYPIYHVKVRWSERYPPETAAHNMRASELPAGRFWNGSSWDTMEREETDVVERLLRDWWPEYSKKLLEPADLTLIVELRCRDTWCSGWFSHWTFDTGQSDQEVLDSFREYVDRIQYSDRPEDEIGSLLMGAEDEWRWHGGERTEAPCRCPVCKERGVVRIDH